MAKISMRGAGTLSGISSMLSERIQSSAMSCQLIDSVQRNLGSTQMVVMVFEKYFMRSSNRASLTVVVTEQDGSVFVDAIGAGGGQGAIFRFSWGAEESFVGTVENILRGYGFQ